LQEQISDQKSAQELGNVHYLNPWSIRNCKV
jgi:hypothetical protein